MIYSSNHNDHGRLGNGIMRLMGLMGLSERYGVEYAIPEWPYAKYFETPINQKEVNRFDVLVKEQDYHYCPEFWDKYEEQFKTKTVNVSAWLQSPKYWGNHKLKFKEDYTYLLWEKHSILFERPTIAISVRRGDFVLNENYYQLPIVYYICALFENFPDWKDYNLVFFSDDIKYCKIHFECLPNAYFAEGSDIEQLALLTLCNHYVISNSTFSYCGAYLSTSSNPTVIRPKYNMAGPLAAKYSEKDFWPEGWKIYDHEGKKINLKDVTFTIPVSFDHQDRKNNLELSVCLLQRQFDTNIILMEQGGQHFKYMSQYVTYKTFEGIEFHRTKMLNDMAKMSETNIIVNFDADVFIPPMQILQSIELIRQGKADMVYPFDGRFARVNRHDNFNKLEKYLDVGVLKDNFRGLEKYDSVGGCVIWDKESFVNGGMENENMVSYGPEDAERKYRYDLLGYTVIQMKGRLFHMDHYVGANSSRQNPHFEKNHEELRKIKTMTKGQLREYVDSWTWGNQYGETYYETITERAISSRDEVFKALHKLKIKPDFVIDIGCGVGEWGMDIKKWGVFHYYGIDYKIPKNRLLISKSQYLEYDLTSCAPFTISDQCDLCICLEVLEHIGEKHAEKAVNLLCALSDTVLFSAAIPGQGGHNHINEQWQTWWEKLFNKNGYYSSEQPFRELIQNNSSVDIWYRNNIVLYSKHFKGKVTDFVHPELFTQVIGHYKALKTA